MQVTEIRGINMLQYRQRLILTGDSSPLLFQLSSERALAPLCDICLFFVAISRGERSRIGMTRVKVGRANALTPLDPGAENSDKPGAGPIHLQNGQRLGHARR